MTEMNIMVTLDSNYVRPLMVMLKSLHISNPNTFFNIYVIHKSLTKMDFDKITSSINKNSFNIISKKISDDMLSNAPITDRYPVEMYYRIFAKDYLPENLDRILYLDPDLVVINSLDTLYNLDFEGCYYAAASHGIKPVNKINELRLNMKDKSIYINSGVLLINLKLLREKQSYDEVFEYIKNYKDRLLFPDQDILSAVYGNKIKPLDATLYNLSENVIGFHNLSIDGLKHPINLKWIRENSVIIHYCGKSKPWKPNYIGILDVFYHEIE